MLKTVGFPSTRTGDQTIVNGNLVIGTAGRGIDFSAVPHAAGMTSELLDDYEEGTWNAGISFGNASVGIVYENFLGVYTKIGNIVNVSAYINISSKGSSTGSARITGLPFTSSAGSSAYAAPALFFTNLTFLGQVTGYVNINGTTIDLFQTSELGTASALTNTNFSNTTAFIINLSYRTNS